MVAFIGFLYVYRCCQNKQRAAAELLRKQAQAMESKRVLNEGSPAIIEPFTMMSPSSVQSYSDRFPDIPTLRTPAPAVASFPRHGNAGDGLKKPPPTSYKMPADQSIESALPERIYSTHGHVSLSSGSAPSDSGRVPQTPISVTPTIGSHSI